MSDAYLLNDRVTVVVTTADDGSAHYLLRDTAAHRAAMAARYGADSEEATEPDEAVELTDDLQVRLGIGLVSLASYTGHRPGTVEDRRGTAERLENH